MFGGGMEMVKGVLEDEDEDAKQSLSIQCLYILDSISWGLYLSKLIVFIPFVS